MKRKRVYVLSLMVIGLLSVLLVRSWWNSSSPFVKELQTDIQSEIPAYRPRTSLFEFIANRSWVAKSFKPVGISNEGELWKFYGDGKFEYSLLTDYDYDLEGTWRIVDFGNSQGLIFLSYMTIPQNPNEDASVWKKQVVFIEAKNKHLNFNFTPFWGKDISMISKNPTMVIVDLAFIQEDFPAYSLLISKRWIKDNDVYKDWMPHELTFFEDGTFYANYVREVPCNFTGNWSMSQPVGNGIELRFSAPNASCDIRGYKGYRTKVDYLLTDANLKNANSSAYNYHAE